MADGDGDETNGTVEEQLIAQDNPLNELARSETIAAVRQAILALPSHYREVVVLCDLHEMSYVEAAEVLRCAVGTVRSRLHRARSLLIERLRPTGEADAADSNNSYKTVRCFA
jgi:RNA polymerase sigma-70 factor (ECF subfamily)